MLEKLIFTAVQFLIAVVLLAPSAVVAQMSTVIDVLRPTGSSVNFGESVTILANGNFVVADPSYNFGAISGVGAVFLYNGRTGSLISILRGTQSFDAVGSDGVVALTNGDFVVCSSRWKNGPLLSRAGAATYCSGTTGCEGEVTPANSIVGTRTNDQVGYRAVALQGGNYVINSPFWNNTVGAATWRSPSMGTSGTITAENSALGIRNNDYIGANSKLLQNGDYLVTSSSWNDNRGAVRQCQWSVGCVGTVSAENSLVGVNPLDSLGSITFLSNGNYVVWGRFGNRGSVTFVNGTTGLVGEIDASNSLVGNPNDNIGLAPSPNSGITALTNGNYIVLSTGWHNTAGVAVGAATWCDGTTGRIGFVTETNSLIGAAPGYFADSSVTPLANGNYVVGCPRWGPPVNAGAVTFGNGKVGTTGVVSAANSFVGNGVNNSFGWVVRALSNGNYVFKSDGWNSSRGATVWADGDVGLVGTVSSSNSLVGTNAGDGGRIDLTVLTNGNYVVTNSNWSNGPNFSTGAVTFCNGLTGLNGEVSTANSLTGAYPQDSIGLPGVVPLTNGNYVVSSGYWNDDRGALTWGNGSTGIIGTVSTKNSLVSAVTNEPNYVEPLPNGNYLVISSYWNANRGLVGWAKGSLTGVLSESYGIVGNIAGDNVGSGGVKIFENGYYAIFSPFYDNEAAVDAGAITFGRIDRPINGRITGQNSVIGYRRFLSGPTFLYDSVNKQFLVSRQTGISLVRLSEEHTDFDYDGDRKADISVFRPADGAWYIQQSQAGLFGTLFGFGSDKIAPADYDGDGKTDVAVYRPSTGIWYVLKSSSGTVEYYVFGLAEDLPTPADYDGDGKADVSVYRPSTGTWYRQNSSDGSYTGIQFGATEDKPTIGDFDGDGKSDIAVFRPSTGAWYRINSGDGSIYGELFGFGTDIITPADYDGDGKTDLAAYRPTDGIWYLKYSSNSSYDYKVFGLANDIPAPADFDGDGKADICVFRPSDGTWYRQNSSNGAFIAFQFGASGDKPTMTAFRY